MSASNTQTAILVNKDGPTTVQRPIPTPENGEVLIKNVSVSSNPKDHKMAGWIPGYEQIEGSDVAGVVEAVGSDVTAFKKGDRVGAFLRIAAGDRNGGYAQYSIAPVNTTFKLADNVNYDDAATIPLTFATALVGLYTKLSLPTPDEPSTTKEPVLIYGASSTVGICATQLAKKSGLYVVGIAGSALEHAKSYGLDEAIDYRGKSQDELVKEIKQAAGGKLRYALDCISEQSTFDTVVKAFSEHGGKIAYTIPLDDSSVPTNVKPLYFNVGSVHADPKDQALAQHYFTQLAKWFAAGEFRGQKVTVLLGGLSAVPEGFKRLESGKISGEKLVYNL